MLPIGSTSIAPSGERSAASSRCVWQASPGRPLMRTPQEPQIAARQEQRMPIEPSCAVLGLEDAVEHRAVAVEVDRELLPVRRLARLGLVAAELERVLGHQYVRSWGSHWVMVTGE